MSLFVAKDIIEILPHRYPFLLVDTIEKMESGVSAVGKKNVTFNEPYFMGHFPKNPVMPGVLIIEALAQVGSIIILSSEEYKGKSVYFAAINSAKFKRKVIPGDSLMLETKIIGCHGKLGKGLGIAKVGDETACIAELSFVIE